MNKTDILEYISQNTMKYISVFSKAERKEYGQFFTNINTADYMASMFSIKSKQVISILDPGCGNAMLSAALIKRIVSEKKADIIELSLYEIDCKIYDLLSQNINIIKMYCLDNDVQLEVYLYKENFIETHVNQWSNDNFTGVYDYIICNPPYKKISKNSSEAVIMKQIVFGQPNIYGLFMALSCHLLKAEGAMVFINPRSWTSGLYFVNLRKYLLQNGSFEYFHLFNSRNKVFKYENVLQETMILLYKKDVPQTKYIKISTSYDSSNYSLINKIKAPSNDCISHNEKNYILIPTNKEELDVLSIMHNFTSSIKKLGFRFKTGPIVEFRNKEFLRHDFDETTIPLIQACNLSKGIVSFHVKTEKHQFYSLNIKNQSVQMKNMNTVFLKRFTTKEENRRLQPALHLIRNCPELSYFTAENHTNFLTKTEGEISVCEAYGFYVLLSSNLFDIYYRILNGSTQVNAEELNDMPSPELEIIQNIGREYLKLHNENYNFDELIRRITA